MKREEIHSATIDFCLEVPEHQRVSGYSILESVLDVMSEEPHFQQRRKDGGLYKKRGYDIWRYFGSPEVGIFASTDAWQILVTHLGGGRFSVLAARCGHANIGNFKSFRVADVQAA